MINVKFKKVNDKIVAFDIFGHAEYDEYGKDIVCSAVSAISITIVNGIREVLKIDAPYSVKDGFLSLDLSNLEKEEIERCAVLMETCFLGLKSIGDNYCEYINVEIGEV